MVSMMLPEMVCVAAMRLSKLGVNGGAGAQDKISRSGRIRHKIAFEGRERISSRRRLNGVTAGIIRDRAANRVQVMAAGRLEQDDGRIGE